MIFGWGKKQKIGLTLSGGGLRGIAHIGILKALEEYNLQPSLISGTSIGAIVGAFYAYGYKPDEIIEIAISGQYFTRQFLHLGNTGLFKSDMLLQLFQRHIPRNSFDNLKIPLYVCATELSHGKSEIFHQGDLHQILLASASVPYLFPPVTIGDKIYSDGGVMNNLPIEAIKDKCDFLIGAHVNASHYNKMHPLSSTKLFARIFQLALNTPVYQKQSSCNLFIDPDNLMQYSFFSSKGLYHLFQLAYEYSSALLEAKGYNRTGDK